MTKNKGKKGKKHEKKANPNKRVCLVEGQIKTLIDSVRGKSNCDAATEYIKTLDRRYDEVEEKEKPKKKKSLLDAILKEAEELFKE